MRPSVYIALLRENPAFARLYLAQLISFAGDWFATVALLGLTLELTGSAGLASVVLILQTGGFAAAAPFAGILADRLDRRRLLIAADLLRVPVALAFLLARGPDTLWIAFVAVALLAIGASVFEPTSSASLPNLVDRDRLPEANVLIGSAWGTMLAVGAALGGVVAVTLGRDAAFVLNALSFALSAWLVLGIRRPMQEAREHPSGDVAAHRAGGPFDAALTAVRFARGRRAVAAFLLSKTTFGLGTGVVALLALFGGQVFGGGDAGIGLLFAAFGLGTGVVALLALFGGQVFGGGDAGIGLLFAARGLGALTGPFLARAIVGSEDHGLLRGIAGSLGVIVVCYALFPAAPTIWAAAPLVFLAHCGGGAQWTLSTLGLQRASPDAIRGRLFSFDYGLVTLTITFSTALAGLLADAVPPAVAVWAMVALIALGGGGWIAFARPAFGRPIAPPSSAPAPHD